MARLRSVRHDEELSLVEHLDELRSRLVVVAIAFAVAFGVCLWQNDYILRAVNRPLGGIKPITLGVAEQFTTTLMVSAYAALLVIMPLLLHQAYAFLLPAFSPRERRVALPLLLMVPVLFLGGVAFGYFAVLPQALEFLLGFNSDDFNVQIRAREYYSFTALSLMAVGVLFQIPVGVLVVTRLGIVTPRQLRRNRRYAILAIAVVAMLLPGTDPVTMLIAMAPLLVLYELSIVLAAFFGRPRSPEEPEEDEGEGPDDDDRGPDGDSSGGGVPERPEQSDEDAAAAVGRAPARTP